MNSKEIKEARISAGLTQKQCAEIFGYSLSGWQKKEMGGHNGRKLSLCECNYLQLLAGTHPVYKISTNEEGVGK